VIHVIFGVRGNTFALPSLCLQKALVSSISGSSFSLAERQARFNALILPHLDRLLAFAMRRTEAAADAEDAVQETCIRAWRALDELRDDARVRAWLYRILRSVLGESAERTARRQQLVSMTRLEAAHEELVAGDGDALFDQIATRLSGEEVRSALAQLPEDFAVAVELHDIDGFKYHEIADIVGVPIGTVMSRISRGRRLLGGAVMANRAGAAKPGTSATRAAKPKGGLR
jgi:RNA polymerase sigma-70 factor (ECF subfamily)